MKYILVISLIAVVVVLLYLRWRRQEHFRRGGRRGGRRGHWGGRRGHWGGRRGGRRGHWGGWWSGGYRGPLWRGSGRRWWGWNDPLWRDEPWYGYYWYNDYTVYQDMAPRYHSPSNKVYTKEDLMSVINLCRTSSTSKCNVIVNDKNLDRRYQYATIAGGSDLVPMIGVDTYVRR